MPLSPDPLHPSRDGNCFLWACLTYGTLECLDKLCAHACPSTGAALSPSGSKEGKASRNEKALLWPTWFTAGYPRSLQCSIRPLLPRSSSPLPSLLFPSLCHWVIPVLHPWGLSPQIYTWKHPSYTPISQSPSELSTANLSRLWLSLHKALSPLAHPHHLCIHSSPSSSSSPPSRNGPPRSPSSSSPSSLARAWEEKAGKTPSCRVGVLNFVFVVSAVCLVTA